MKVSASFSRDILSASVIKALIYLRLDFSALYIADT